MRGARLEGGLFEGSKGRALRVAPQRENGRLGVRSSVSQFLKQRNVVHAVTDCGVVKTSAGPRRMVWPDGWTDITAILPITARVWLIECKTESGTLEDSQVDLHPVLEATGGLLTVARSVEDVRTVLNAHCARFTAAELDEYFTNLWLVRKGVEAARNVRVAQAQAKKLTKKNAGNPAVA